MRWTPVDEGIEVLTGVPAGAMRRNGTYPAHTVNHLAARKLQSMARKLKNFGKPNAKDSSQETEETAEKE